MNCVRRLARGLLGAACILQIAGCPTAPSTPLEFIAGGVGDTFALSDVASVVVLSPVSDLSIVGGTPVEVNWRAVATTRSAVLDVLVDVDLIPDNNNELVAFSNLDITESTALVDTTTLDAGDYFMGVTVKEAGRIVAFGYAAGRVTINQRPVLFFTSPRDNFAFDRTEQTNPRFDVAWQVFDPDSIVTVQIFLDPDNAANGNEVLLRESNSQTGDQFTFDLPTAGFEPGEYFIFALVSDGVDSFAFFAPGRILLRSRLAGVVDLRDMHLPEAGIAGAIFEGFHPRDNAGSFVKSVGDLDQDGFAEMMILSQFAKPQFQLNFERTGVGEAYLIYGRADRFSGKINLNSTGRLFRGDVFTGVPEVADPIRPTRGITSFDVLSDWDGDGFRELAFGVPFVDSLPVGSLGAGTGADLCAPNDGPGYFRSGAVVVASSSSLRPDLGFPGQTVANLAEYGTLDYGDNALCPCPEGLYGPKAVAANVAFNCYHRHNAICTRGALRLGCRLSSNDFGDQFGETVSGWDFDSIIMSAPNRNPFVATSLNNAINNSIEGAGVISIYFVRRSGQFGGGFIPWATETDQVPQANEAFNYPGLAQMPFDTIPHWGPYHYIVDDFRQFEFPGGVFISGDIDFRGHPGYTVDGPPTTDAEPCTLLIDVNAPLPRNTIRIWGGFPGARIGNAQGIDDFNADGLLDMLVGSPLSDEGAGATFIVLGRLRDLMIAGEFNIDELGLPLNSSDRNEERVFDGIRVVGSRGDRLGQSQDGAGDFNGDGIADVIIGSPLVNSRRGGAAIFFGSREVINLSTDEIPFDEIPSRGLGVIFVGQEEGDLAGARVAGVGDIDGDGNDDVLIAAPNRSVTLDVDLDGTLEIDRTNCGVVYLIYGSPELRGTINLAQIGTEQLPGAVFIGRNSGDFLGAGLGEQGDRSTGIAAAGDVDGDGRGDILLGSVAATPRGGRVRAGEVYLLYGAGD